VNGFQTRDQITLTNRPSQNLDGLEVDLARRIDEICRRFEAGWCQGRHPRIEEYLFEVPDKRQPAFRTETEAPERELRQSK
jgi:hypothetical protein